MKFNVLSKICFVVAGLILAGCNTSTPQPTPVPPTPTFVAKNADWQPVSETINGYEMVKVPAGCFMMGNDKSRRDERPAHQVCISSAFWIDTYEVTNGQFGSDGPFPGEKRPRTNMTWIEARDFCKTRGARLPSEAEWEYAARGPESLIYPWGNELVPENLVYDKNMVNSNEPEPVGSRPTGVSWVGAYDLSGNVWEWVNSVYKRYPYDPADGRENEDDLTVKRLYRGGWLSYVDYGSGATMRFEWKADDRNWNTGFRCAISDSEAQKLIGK